jgi:Bacterial sugar transferase
MVLYKFEEAKLSTLGPVASLQLTRQPADPPRDHRETRLRSHRRGRRSHRGDAVSDPGRAPDQARQPGPDLFRAAALRLQSAAVSHHQVSISRYARRHNVRPGITGWAQIHGYRGETDTEEKMRKRVEYDLYYIDNWSLWLATSRSWWHGAVAQRLPERLLGSALVNAASLAFSAFNRNAAVLRRRRLRKRSRDAVEWIGEQIVFFGMSAEQIRRLIAYILDDRVTDPLDLGTDRSLEIYSRREMRMVRHHVELRVAIISDGRKVAFGRCSLAFRAARNKEYRNIQSASPLKDLKRWCYRRVTPELVPRSPTARRVNRQITKTRNGAAKIVAFQNLPVGKCSLVNVEDEGGSLHRRSPAVDPTGRLGGDSFEIPLIRTGIVISQGCSFGIADIYGLRCNSDENVLIMGRGRSVRADE